ncbi:interleukin-13 receptor subunit alpha-1 [Phycodurus eques]|uniref:interleukin-13 receptor subunit alpha-1 n=1 Tax=Phycodurus eques TaxID=693459 RepID=UPI002ACE02C6|nr:interleukin-13 receptor subunit alpha-1 [Phycodurus eques]
MREREAIVYFIWAVFFHPCLSFAPHSQAGGLPPPTNLSHVWLDWFTVNVSWWRPSRLPERCRIQYRYGPDNSSTEWTHFTETLLTDEAGSSGWIFTVQTESDCQEGRSAPASILVDTPIPRAQLVTDFKCLLRAEKTTCSWVPVDPSVNLTLSYRICGLSEETRRGLKECKRPYRQGFRNGCDLTPEFVNEDICMLVKSEASMSTFKPQLAVDLPSLRVSVEGDKFNLSWTPPEVGKHCSWTYELCYKQCDEQEKCQSFVPNGETMQIAYDKRCRYGFRYRVTSGGYCKRVQSDFSAVEYHGVNAPARVSPTTVAVAIAAVLSAIVLLTCCCFRRHSAVFCPVIPDPSAILKDMMIGSTEMKSSTNLYTPVPEPIQPCQAIGARKLVSFTLHAAVTRSEPIEDTPSQGETPW